MSVEQRKRVEYEQFPCNYFQIVAIQLNIRYNAGVALPEVATVNQVTVLFYQAISQLGGNAQAGVLPSQPPQGHTHTGRPIILREKIDRTPGANVKLKFTPPIVASRNSRSLEELVSSNLYPDVALPALGPARLFLYTKDATPTATSIVSAAVVNCNAALWDAVTLKNVMTTFRVSFSTHIEKKTVSIPKPAYTQLGGWAKILHETQGEKNPEPKYLPIGELGEKPKKIDEILPKPQGSKPTQGSERRVHVTLGAETVAACREVLGDKEPSAVTTVLSDFGVACFTLALSEVFFQNHVDPKVTIAQTLQIDPRVSFSELAENPSYLHAIAVLSVGRTVYRAECDEKDTVDWLLSETKRVGLEVVTRMDRGEAIRKALEIATGKSDKENMVPAVELVDHGVYSSEIELGHRFDLCELMSAVVHLETDTGVLKLEAQIGSKQDRDATVALLERITEFWKLVATSAAKSL